MAIRRVAPYNDHEFPLFSREVMRDSLRRGFIAPPSKGLFEAARVLSPEAPDLQILEELIERIRQSGMGGAKQSDVAAALRMIEEQPINPKAKTKKRKAAEKRQHGFKRLRQREDITEQKARRLRDRLFADYKATSRSGRAAAAAELLKDSVDPGKLAAIFQYKDGLAATEEINNLFMDDLVKSGLDPQRAREAAEEVSRDFKEVFDKAKNAADFEEGIVGTGTMSGSTGKTPEKLRRSPSVDKALMFTPDDPRGKSRIPNEAADSVDNLTDEYIKAGDYKTAANYKPSEKMTEIGPVFTDPETPASSTFSRQSKAANFQVAITPTKGSSPGKKPNAPYDLTIVNSKKHPGYMEVRRVQQSKRKFKTVDGSFGLSPEQGEFFQKELGLTDDQVKKIVRGKNNPNFRAPLLIPHEDFFVGREGKKPLIQTFASGGNVTNYNGDAVTPEMLADPKVRERLQRNAANVTRIQGLSPGRKAAAIAGPATIEEVKDAIGRAQGFSRAQPVNTNRQLAALRRELNAIGTAKATRGFREPSVGSIRSPKFSRGMPRSRQFKATRGSVIRHPLARVVAALAQKGLKGGL